MEVVIGKEPINENRKGNMVIIYTSVTQVLMTYIPAIVVFLLYRNGRKEEEGILIKVCTSSRVNQISIALDQKYSLDF